MFFLHVFSSLAKKASVWRKKPKSPHDNGGRKERQLAYTWVLVPSIRPSPPSLKLTSVFRATWVAAGSARRFRAGETCELFPPHMLSSVALLCWCDPTVISLAQKTFEALPFPAVGWPTHRNCCLWQDVTRALNIAATWQSFWCSAFLSLPWTPGRLWGAFCPRWRLGETQKITWSPLGHSLSATVACTWAGQSVRLRLRDLEPFILSGVSIFSSPSHFWGLMVRQLWWGARTWSPASPSMSCPLPSTRKAFVCKGPSVLFLPCRAGIHSPISQEL